MVPTCAVRKPGRPRPACAALAGAAAGVVLTLGWIDAPEWLIALPHVLLGWGASALPTLIATLVAAGGVLDTAGAVIYARRRPDPVSAVFGYHEASTPG